MLILGVDPGLANTGWGVIESGASCRLLAAGVIRTKTGETHTRRLGHIADELRKVAHQWRPQQACVERVFVNNNAKSTLALGEARGAALAALWAADVDVVEMTALQIKKSITGAGRADKKAVAMMVRRLLGLAADAKKLPADASDALACALSLTTMTQLGGYARAPSRRRQGRWKTLPPQLAKKVAKK